MVVDGERREKKERGLKKSRNGREAGKRERALDCPDGA